MAGLGPPTVTLASFTDLDYGTVTSASDPSATLEQFGTSTQALDLVFKNSLEYVVEWDNVPASAVSTFGRPALSAGQQSPPDTEPLGSCRVRPTWCSTGTVLIIVDPSSGSVLNVFTLAE
jgi:hypothetical protein